MYLRQFHSTLGFSWLIFSIYQILGVYSIIMALWTDLVLATMSGLVNSSLALSWTHG